VEPLTIIGGGAAVLAWAGTSDYAGPRVDAPAVGDGVPMNGPSSRGVVLPLTARERVQRWRYLAGEATIDTLDAGVRREGRTGACPDIFYRLKVHNGGKDPSAPDPATYWRKDAASTFVNRTSDCIGGAAWGAGFDRYQPARFPVYDGWINTDSMIIDATGKATCFRVLREPEPGCFVVARSGSYGPNSIGHIGGVVDVPSAWDPSVKASWSALGVVDIAGRDGRANKRTTGAGWYGRGLFVVSIMK